MRYSERITQSSSPGKYFFVLIFLFLLFAISAVGQTREEKKMRVKAVKALQQGNYSEAQNIYFDLIKLDPQNPDYNYEMGLAIFDEGIHRGKAAPYFEKAIIYMKSDTLPDMFLFAGKAEQYAGNFEIAVSYFKTYMALKRKEGVTVDMLEEDVIRYIEMCENGKVQFENNKEFIRIENLGTAINTEYVEHSPLVDNEETKLLFTSRRENTTGGELADDGKYFEDIYYTLNLNGTWTPAENYDSTSRYMYSGINTDDHDATITFAGDNTELFIYREQDVWVSAMEDGVWTMPVRAEGNINSEKGAESSIFITQDEQTMFVVSDRGSGYGGRDIYVTTKDEEGKFRQLENLGKVINTKFDEDAPFLTPDGNTLYFASTGHNSMGGYDLFKCTLEENGEWSTPENLGPPINTPGDDSYFVTTDNGAVAYYTSDRDGGYGATDIYRIILDCKAVSATMIRGVVFSEDQQKPIGGQISIYEGEKLINTYTADSVTGKYEMRLKTETQYRFRIAANGYMPHSGEFTVPKQCDYYSLFQEIKIDNMEDSLGRVYAQRAFINNAFFNIDQKVEQDFAEEVDLEEADEATKDSLRSMVAANYNPLELTNYVKMIDILDPNGVRLGSEIIGEQDVAKIQSRDQQNLDYNRSIINADQYYYNQQLPEARANYIVAGIIDSTQAYPKQQVKKIDEELAEEPFEALLATIPEVDESELIVEEGELEIKDESALIVDAEEHEIKDESALILPDDVAENMPEVIQEETKEPIAPAIAAVPHTPAKEEPEVVEPEPEVAVVPEPEVAVVPEPKKEEATVAEPKAEETVVFRNILFDFDRSFLREESKQELTKISDYMSTKKAVELRIDGHADWIGTVEYNMALSERRAKTAYEYLVEKGVNEGRLNYQFFGESVPIAPNENADGSDNPEGRQLNRRCEFKFDKSGTADNVVLKF